jgi:hypothetical protein
MNKCTAITKKKKPCPIFVEEWRVGGMCHVHDPNGKFRKQIKSGENRASRIMGPKTKGCQHAWYMRDPGITCTKCGIVWEKETDSTSFILKLDS